MARTQSRGGKAKKNPKAMVFDETSETPPVATVKKSQNTNSPATNSCKTGSACKRSGKIAFNEMEPHSSKGKGEKRFPHL